MVAGEEVAVRERIYADLAELRARRQLLSATLQDNPSGSTPDPTSEDRARLAAIEHLDAFEYPCRVRDTHRNIFASTKTSGALSWANALPLLFTYAITPSRPCSGHRRYLVARLLSIEREHLQGDTKRVTRSTSLANRATLPPADLRVEDVFIRWVESLDSNANDKREVRLLAEELFRGGVMNYGAYLQRMIARGETERDPHGGDGESIHLWILRTVALDPSLAGVKRRVAGGGDEATAGRARRIESKLAQARDEIAELFAQQDSTAPQRIHEHTSQLYDTVEQLVEDGSHWTITREVLPTALAGRINAATGRLEISRNLLAAVCHIYQSVKDWPGLLQVRRRVYCILTCPPRRLLALAVFQLLAVTMQLGPSDEVLTHAADIAHSRLDIWASLDALSDLGAALYGAFQQSKVDSPTGNRRLLELLHDFGENGLLDPGAQTALKQELQTLASAASPSTDRQSSPALPVPLPEMLVLRSDTSVEAVSKVASSLWHRYRGHPSWIAAVFDSVIVYITQMATIEPLVDLVRQLEARMPLGVFSNALAPYTAGMRVAQAETLFGSPSGAATASFFAELAVAGVIHPIALQQHLVAPARRVMLRMLLQAESAADVNASVTAVLRNIQSVLTPIIGNLAGKGSPTAEMFADLPRRQKIASRRSSLTRQAGLPSIAGALASLIVEQEVAARLGLETHAEATGAYFVQLASLPRFQALFARAPRMLRDGMLDNLELNALPGVEDLRPNLLAGLLVILKDGGAGEHIGQLSRNYSSSTDGHGRVASPASLGSTEELDVFLSGLTIWRLNISKVEVVACLERLELDPNISATERYEALHTLSKHFLERVCSGDGKSYLGEQVVRCYSGTASDEVRIACVRSTASYAPADQSYHSSLASLSSASPVPFASSAPA